MAGSDKGALSGVLVLDLSQVLAGPWASMQLADLGARVIKVERAGRGDQTRRFGPPFVGGESTYYLSTNRNKESAAVDLAHPGVRRWVLSVAEQADVVLANFRPGRLEELGLGFDELERRNPRLVMASISAFGRSGLERWSQQPGYDLTLQGWGGIPGLTGPADGPPFKVAASIADIAAGMFTVQAILAALYHREKSGRGQRIDTSMFECQLALLGYHWSAWLNAGAAPERRGNRHASVAPYGAFQASDGWLFVAAASDSLFQKLCALLGVDELASDQRFATNPLRVAAIEELEAALACSFRRATVDQWLERLGEAGIPAGPIATVPQALAHPQLAARDAIATLPHPTAGTVQQLVSPLRLSRTPTEIHSPPPLRGEHTRALLREFGVSDEELGRWEAEGAVECRPEGPAQSE